MRHVIGRRRAGRSGRWTPSGRPGGRGFGPGRGRPGRSPRTGSGPPARWCGGVRGTDSRARQEPSGSRRQLSEPAPTAEVPPRAAGPAPRRAVRRPSGSRPGAAVAARGRRTLPGPTPGNAPRAGGLERSRRSTPGLPSKRSPRPRPPAVGFHRLLKVTIVEEGRALTQSWTDRLNPVRGQSRMITIELFGVPRLRAGTGPAGPRRRHAGGGPRRAGPRLPGARRAGHRAARAGPPGVPPLPQRRPVRDRPRDAPGRRRRAPAPGRRRGGLTPCRPDRTAATSGSIPGRAGPPASRSTTRSLRAFLGGVGLGTWIVAHETPAGTDPLGARRGPGLRAQPAGRQPADDLGQVRGGRAQPADRPALRRARLVALRDRGEARRGRRPGDHRRLRRADRRLHRRHGRRPSPGSRGGRRAPSGACPRARPRTASAPSTARTGRSPRSARRASG